MQAHVNSAFRGRELFVDHMPKAAFHTVFVTTPQKHWAERTGEAAIYRKPLCSLRIGNHNGFCPNSPTHMDGTAVPNPPHYRQTLRAGALQDRICRCKRRRHHCRLFYHVQMLSCWLASKQNIGCEEALWDVASRS